MMDDKFKFDVVIGNPPYHEKIVGSNNKEYSKSIYNYFMDEAYKISNIVEMIHPARFLFNAGRTPKNWNKKMLNSSHIKVLYFEQNSNKVFPNTDIKGGIAVTYRNPCMHFSPIKIFTPFNELNKIIRKAAPNNDMDSLTSIIYTQNKFDLKKLYDDYPSYKEIIGSNGKDKRFRNNIFEKIPLFSKTKKDKSDIAIIGLINNKRVWRYIPSKYVDMNHENLNFYKVLIPRSNGSGALGEVLSTPLIGEPLIGYTQTFIGVGKFNKFEAESCFKYVKSKFCRVMLGVLKATQDNNKDTWAKVPLQDFSSNSDIDWSQSIHDIDKQLYKKYDLSTDEINFIETKVKEMK